MSVKNQDCFQVFHRRGDKTERGEVQTRRLWLVILKIQIKPERASGVRGQPAAVESATAGEREREGAKKRGRERERKRGSYIVDKVSVKSLDWNHINVLV